MRHLPFTLISWMGVTSLVSQADPQLWIMIGVLITSLASIIQTWIAGKREERRRQWDIEDRIARMEEIKAHIVENTALTRETSAKADAAYQEANGVNAKIASLAAGARAVDNGVRRIEETSADTNETAHRIENKL